MQRGTRFARASWLALGLVAGGVALFLWATPARKSPSNRIPTPKTCPNVILISIDSLRPDHLGCYGYHRETSPCIDRLAAQGALFENATSSTSWTLPAHAAMFTGLVDSVHGCKDMNSWLPSSRETLAERFQAAGYKTVGFFSGPLLHPHFGLGQGFDTYHDCTSYSRESIDLLKGIPGEKSILDRSHEDITNPIVLEEVGRWLAANRSGPRFVFIHLWDVHYDYIPPPPFDKLFDPDYSGWVDGRNIARFTVGARPPEMTDRDLEHMIALYDGEIRWTDHTLEKLLALFDAHGLGTNTLLVITADHGEAFYEHGVLGHTHSLHEEELRIPLIFHYPGVIPAGLRIARQAHITDVAPTLLSLARLSALPQAMGLDLSPLLLGTESTWPERMVVAELFDATLGLRHFSLRAEGWKSIWDYLREQRSVFDLTIDPGERHPLEGERLPLPGERLEEIHREFVRDLQEAARALPMPAQRDAPPIPSMTEQQLRALGYLR